MQKLRQWLKKSWQSSECPSIKYAISIGSTWFRANSINNCRLSFMSHTNGDMYYTTNAPISFHTCLLQHQICDVVYWADDCANTWNTQQGCWTTLGWWDHLNKAQTICHCMCLNENRGPGTVHWPWHSTSQVSVRTYYHDNVSWICDYSNGQSLRTIDHWNAN